MDLRGFALGWFRFVGVCGCGLFVLVGSGVVRCVVWLLCASGCWGLL